MRNKWGEGIPTDTHFPTKMQYGAYIYVRKDVALEHFIDSRVATRVH